MRLGMSLQLFSTCKLFLYTILVIFKSVKEQDRHGSARPILPVAQPEPEMNITFLISRISTSKKTNNSFRSVQ
jgi:hypothetical protein